MTTDAPLAASNPRVKAARKLGRRSTRAERRLFVADGPKAVAAALAATDCVVEVFATGSPDHDELRSAAGAAGVRWTVVDDRAMAGLSDSVSPAGVVAVCRFLDVPLPDAVSGGDLVTICADVRDPGNAGTVVRTADAVGADAVVLAGRSVDPYNPKTVRATVGSLFHLPLALASDPAEAVRAARAAGQVVVAADGYGELDLFDADPVLRGPVAWLFGNEARGLPQALTELADHRVSIPMAGHAESLNLSTAAAVCLYATARARTRD